MGEIRLKHPLEIDCRTQVSRSIYKLTVVRFLNQMCDWMDCYKYWSTCGANNISFIDL